MDAVAMAVGISWTFVGLLCLGLAIPLARGRVRRNLLYGVRFAESLRSDEEWFEINRYGGRRMIVWSLPLIAVGIAALFLPLRSRPGLALFLGFAPLVLVLVPVVETWRFARRRWPGDDRPR